MISKSVHTPSLIWSIVFLVAGICLNTYGLPSPSGFAKSFLPFILIVCFLHFLCKPYFNTPSPGLWLFLILGWGISSLQQNSFHKYAKKLDHQNQITGTIEEISHYRTFDRVLIRLPVERWWSPSHHLIINLQDKNNLLEPGQTIRLERKPDRIATAKYPFGFNAQKYWWLHHVSHEIWFRPASDIKIIHTKPMGSIYRMRKNAMTRLDTLYPAPHHAGILKALVAGDRSGLTSEVITHFKKSGLMHVLAVSGLHVGIVFGLLYIIFYPFMLLGLPKRVLFLLIIFALWIYAFWTGLNIPVIRAVILSTFFLMAARLKRQMESWNVYCWAVLIVLVIDPRSLFSVSMQLSYGAVAAILLFYNPINNWFKRNIGSNYFTSLIAVSIAAQLGVFPFLMWHFQEISMVSTISGLFVIPLLFPIILLAAVSLVLPAAWEGLINIISGINQILVQLILDVSDTLAQWSLASLILVWHPITILVLSAGILSGGIYLAIKERPLKYTWIRNISLTLVGIGILIEVGNIRNHRRQPYVVQLEYKYENIREFHYKGWCYTSFTGETPLFLKKMRAQHYVRSIRIIKSDQEWASLFSRWEQQIMGTSNPGPPSIWVDDYLSDAHYPLSVKLREAGHSPSADQTAISPLLSAFKNYSK